MRVSVLDVMKVMTGNSSHHENWLLLSERYREVCYGLSLQVSGQGQRDTPDVTTETTRWIARKSCRARMSSAQEREQMEISGCGQGDIELEMQLITVEELMEQLGAAFAASSPFRPFPDRTVQIRCSPIQARKTH